MSKEFMILSLDGGGALGLYQATILRYIESVILKGSALNQKFNLITGTSTGGLIALSLASGHSTEELIQFYKSKSKEIFPKRFFYPLRFLNMIFLKSKYSNKSLKKVLIEHFGDLKMKDLQIPVCINAVDAVNCTPLVYKTKNAPRLTRDMDESLVDIALATSAAPIYFPTYKFGKYQSVIDGGIWQNNPSFVGLIEANTNYICTESGYDRISLLSIGNPISNTKISFVSRWTNCSSLLAWRTKLVTLPMKVSSNGIDLQMKMIKRTNAMNLNNYLRVATENIPTALNNLKMDSSRDADLEKMESQAYHDFNMNKNDLISFFFDNH